MKCSRLRCCVNNSFLVFPQGNQTLENNQTPALHTRVSYRFLVFGSLDETLKLIVYINVIIDYHACVEYLSKYAAKSELRSTILNDALTGVVYSKDPISDTANAVKRVMIKTLGEHDYGAQETMHLLLSLKLHSSTFHAKKTTAKKSEYCTKDSLLDFYAKRKVFQNSHPNILDLNVVNFATQFKVVNKKLQSQPKNAVAGTFPNYSQNPKSKTYGLYCKYQLLKYKPWTDLPSAAWGYLDPCDNNYISAILLMPTNIFQRKRKCKVALNRLFEQKKSLPLLRI